MAGAKKIFLVEDDSDIASLLQLSLKDEGYEIVHEADGARALESTGETRLGCRYPRSDAAGCRRAGDLSSHSPNEFLFARYYHQRPHQ